MGRRVEVVIAAVSASLVGAAFAAACTGAEPDLRPPEPDAAAAGDSPNGQNEDATPPLCEGCTIVASIDAPAELGRLVVADGFVYFTTTTSEIWRAPVDLGAPPAKLATHNHQVGGLAVADGVVYFGGERDDTKDAIYVVPAAGGTPAELVGASEGTIERVAVEGGTVYWSEGKVVHAAPIDGGPEKTLATANQGVSGVSPAGSLVYWGYTTGADSDPKTGVGSCAPPACDGGLHELFRAPVQAAELYARGGYLYFRGRDDTSIRRALADGGNAFDGGPYDVVARANGSAKTTSLAVDDAHLYYADDGASVITRANVDGSNPTALVQGVAGVPRRLTLDATSIYWRNERTIYRHAK